MTQGFIHHIHKRKTQQPKELAQYPHPNPKMRMLDRVMLIGATVGPMANVPQIVQLYSSKDAGGLSFTTWLFFLIINSLWIFYGVAHKEKLIIFASISTAIFQIPIIIGILIY